MAQPSMSNNPTAYDSTPPQYNNNTSSPYNADAIGSSTQPKDSGTYTSGYISPEHTGPSGAIPGVGGIHQGAYTGPGAGHGQEQAYEMSTPANHNHQEAYGKASSGMEQDRTQGQGGYYANPPAGQTQYYGPQAAQGAPTGQHGSAPGQHAGQGPPAGGEPPNYSKYRAVVPISALSSNAAPVDCPACHQRAMTATTIESGNTTNAWAAGLCLVACLGCIPYCISSTKDVVHKCGNCGVTLATWHRSGRTEVHLQH